MIYVARPPGLPRRILLILFKAKLLLKLVVGASDKYFPSWLSRPCESLSTRFRVLGRKQVSRYLWSIHSLGDEFVPAVFD